jgi:hypothetical protein
MADVRYLRADRETIRLVQSSPQGAGLSAIAQGFALLHGTEDHRKIQLESPMYDALFAWCEQQST